MRLGPQDTRSPSGGGGSAPAPVSLNPRAGTEQTVLFSTTTELPVATQTLLQAARERLGAQVKIREDGHMLDKDLPCPIQARFIRCAPEHDHQTKNQCMLCNTFVKGGFPMKVMHLMGNSGKDSTSGCGYTGQTRPRCKFFCKVQHREMQQDLHLVGGAHKGGGGG